MMNKLFLIQKTGRLACKWVVTGDPKTPLLCVWTASKAPAVIATASAADETGRCHLCA
jgi:hypothetical protein